MQPSHDEQILSNGLGSYDVPYLIIRIAALDFEDTHVSLVPRCHYHDLYNMAMFHV